MRSLQQRLTLGLLAMFALLVIAGGAALYLTLRAALLDQYDAGLRVKAMVVITATRQERGKLRVHFSDQFLKEFNDKLATDYFQVWVRDGKSVARSDSLGNRNLPRNIGTMEEPVFWNMQLPRNRGAGRAIGIRFSPQIDPDDKHDPLEGEVVVAAQRGELDAMRERLAIAIAVAGGALLAATSLAVPLTLRPGLRPVRRMADLAESIDATTLGQRFEANEIPHELRPVCDRMNDLLSRLEASFERERRFSSNLAHELLTPLAELRAIAESVLKWPDTASLDDHRRSVEILLRMESLVVRVLDLSRAENGRLVIQARPVDVPELFREIANASEAEATTRGIGLVWESATPLSVISDAGMLRVILGNLVSNAVTYAPENGQVRLRWNATEGGAEISVANAAPQISDADLPRLFERFWRKDSSRSDNRHSGLGLSLSLQLAEALHGSLSARRTAGDELEFILKLPAVSPQPQPEAETILS